MGSAAGINTLAPVWQLILNPGWVMDEVYCNAADAAAAAVAWSVWEVSPFARGSDLGS